MAERALCFHSRTKCPWCYGTSDGRRPAKPKPRLHCNACGRFRAWSPAPVCGRCDERGFEPLTLPFAA